MTTARATEVAARRRRVRPIAERRSARVDLLEALKAQLEAEHRVRFPSPRYRADPVAFVREILGIEPTPQQIEILEAVRDHMSVAVKSGHKVGKSATAAMLALWFYCSFIEGRAIMSSTTARQVDTILWRELMMLRGKSGRCVDCKAEDPDGRRIAKPCPHSAMIEGEIGMLARTGLKSDDFREIVGFTAREAEAVAGISGGNLMYIIDEASGVPDVIFEAIEGNRAGGARLVMFSNPTKTKGYFFDAFHDAAAYWHCITISSEQSPNVISGEMLIPGMAWRGWIEERRREWGETSPQYRIRVLGEFALGEDGKIFSFETIAAAEARWDETPAEGRLFIGLDPAGPGGSGDESVFVLRRGLKLIELTAHRGLTDDGHLAHVLGLVLKHRQGREVPVLVIDRDGSIGAGLAGRLRAYVESKRAGCEFRLVAVRPSDRALRQPRVYDRMRDELTANLEQWFRDGGAIVEDVKLSGELHEPEWEHALNGRMKVTRKALVRKELGRSPDRYDALALAVWEPSSLRHEASGEDADDDETSAPDTDAYGAPAVDAYDSPDDPNYDGGDGDDEVE